MGLSLSLNQARVLWIEPVDEGTEWLLEYGDTPYWGEDEELEEALERLNKAEGRGFCIELGDRTIMGLVSPNWVLSAFFLEEDEEDELWNEEPKQDDASFIIEALERLDTLGDAIAFLNNLDHCSETE